MTTSRQTRTCKDLHTTTTPPRHTVEKKKEVQNGNSCTGISMTGIPPALAVVKEATPRKALEQDRGRRGRDGGETARGAHTGHVDTSSIKIE